MVFLWTEAEAEEEAGMATAPPLVGRASLAGSQSRSAAEGSSSLSLSVDDEGERGCSRHNNN